MGNSHKNGMVALNGDLVFHTLLTAKLNEAQVTGDELAERIGVYPSYIEAVLAGELLPSDELAEEIIRHLLLVNGGEDEFLRVALSSDRTVLEKGTSEKFCWVMDVMAGTTLQSSLQTVLQKIFDPEGPYDNIAGFARESGIGDSTLRHKRKGLQYQSATDGESPAHYTGHDTKFLAKLTSALNLPKSVAALLVDIAEERKPSKTFAQMIDEAIAAEPRPSFRDFVLAVSDEWKMGRREFADAIGIDNSRVVEWVAGTLPDHRAIDRMVKNLLPPEREGSLGEEIRQKRIYNLWRIARGREVGTLDSIMDAAQTSLEAGEPAREVTSELIKKLEDYTGFNNAKVAADTGKSSSTIATWKSEGRIFRETEAALLAGSFVPFDAERQKRLTALFQGVPQAEQKELSTLIEEACEDINTTITGLQKEGKNGLEIRKAIKAGAREYFGNILGEALRRRGETFTDFAPHIGISRPETIGEWVSGKSRPLREDAEKLADELGIKDTHAKNHREMFIRLAREAPWFYDPQIITDVQSGKISRSEGIKAIRMRNGLSQIEMGRELGMENPKNWENWERKGLIPYELLYRFMDVTAVPGEKRKDFVALFKNTVSNHLDEQRRGSAEYAQTP